VSRPMASSASPSGTNVLPPSSSTRLCSALAVLLRARERGESGEQGGQRRPSYKLRCATGASPASAARTKTCRSWCPQGREWQSACPQAAAWGACACAGSGRNPRRCSARRRRPSSMRR
jgi:hypothetical protein